LAQKRCEDQWDVNPYSYIYLIVDKDANNGEKTATSTNVAGKTGYLPAEN
jgi:hypothetical protein